MLVTIHRFLAALLAIFIVSHLIVHMSALGGVEDHLKWLEKVQPIYRNRFVEPILIIAVISQISVGLSLSFRRIRAGQVSRWGWAQILSGGYLMFFLLMHTSAALITRHVVGLETNFYWASGTLASKPLSLFFYPYYFLAITSLFVHLAAGIHFNLSKQHNWLPKLLVFLGLFLASLITLTFGGWLYEIQLPTEYLDYYQINA